MALLDVQRTLPWQRPGSVGGYEDSMLLRVVILAMAAGFLWGDRLGIWDAPQCPTDARVSGPGVRLRLGQWNQHKPLRRERYECRRERRRRGRQSRRPVLRRLHERPDTPTCGSPASPCRTPQYCLNDSNTSANARWRIGAPTTNQIQAVCIKGTCANTTMSLTQDGAAGTWTRTKSGSEDRDFQYPRYPLVISGWDTDNANVYPPMDPDDSVVFDGNVSGNTPQAFDSNGHSRFEVAHLRFRDYNLGCTDYGALFGKVGDGTSHQYFHDLAVNNFAAYCNQSFGGGGACYASGWEAYMFQLYSNSTVAYWAVENLDAQNVNGYWTRGSSPNGTAPTEISGPWRFKNWSTTQQPDLTCGSTMGFKFWGRTDGIEVLDSSFDSKAGVNYSPAYDASIYALDDAQCTSGVTVRNNYFKNWKQAFRTQPTAGTGYCNAYNIDNVVFDANEVEITTPGTGCTGRGSPANCNFVWEGTNDGDATQQHAVTRTYTNNVFRTNDPDIAWGIAISNSRSGSALTGSLTIANNTFEMGGASCNSGVISLCSQDCLTYSDQTVTIKNNIIRGCASGGNPLGLYRRPSNFTIPSLADSQLRLALPGVLLLRH